MVVSKSMRGRRAARFAVESLETRLLMSTNSWKSAVSGNWEDASRWSLGHVPLSTEDVTITAPGTYTVSAHGAGGVANTIVLGSATAHPILDLTSDNTVGYAFITAQNGFTNNATINLIDNSPGGYIPRVAVTAGALTNTATGVINASGTAVAQIQPASITGNFVSMGGKINVAGTWVLQVQGGVTLGTTSFTGTGIFSLNNDTVTIPAAGCSFASHNTTVTFQSATVNGPGTLTNTAGSTLNLYNTVVNAPLVNQGTIVGYGTGSNVTGSFTTTAASVINLTSDNTIGYAYLTSAIGFTNNGTINLTDNSAGGYVTHFNITSGALTNAPTGVINASGTAIAQVQPALINGGFTSAGGKINAVGKWVLQISGAVTLGNGVYPGTGTVSMNNDAISVAAGGSSFASGNSNVTFQGATINGPGTLTNTAGSRLNLYNTVINAAVVNQGIIASYGTASNITGSLTTTAASIINLISDNTIGYAYLTSAIGFINNGTINLTDNSPGGYVTHFNITSGALTNAPTGIINASGTATAQVQPALINGGFASAGGKINAVGKWVLQISGPVTLGNGVYPGTGTVSMNNDAITVPASGCSFTSGKSNVTFQGSTINGPGILTNKAGSTLILYNTVVNAAVVNQGTIASHGTGSSITGAFSNVAGSAINLTSDNVIGYAYLTFPNSITNNGTIALTNNSPGGYVAHLIVTNGTLTNSATGIIRALATSVAQAQPDTIVANISNAGTLAVNIVGGLIVSGNYVQTATGTYAITLPGTTTISGTATLSGLIDIYHTAAFKAVIGTKYPVLRYASHTGNFTSHDGWSLGGGVQVNNSPAALEYDLVGTKAIADSAAPTASALTVTAPVPSAKTVTFSVTYSDNVAIDVSTLGNTNVLVTGPSGFSKMATLVSMSKTNNGTPRVAVYSITPTIGRVDVGANGTYTVKTLASSVMDTSGHAVAAATLGTFTIAIKPKLVFFKQPPATAKAGKAITPAIVVKIEDLAGNVITTDTSTVTIGIFSGPIGATVTGTPAVKAIAGIATFSNVILAKAGTYKLKAIDGSDTAGVSASLVVNP